MNVVKRFSPTFLKLVEETSRQCFGNLPVVNYRTGNKLLRKKPIGPIASNHYISDIAKSFRANTDNFNTEQEERRIDKLVRLRRKGKGPPKKGQGRRASKKKR